MKPKSISGIVFYVKDTAKTAAFYEALGFRPGKNEEEVTSVYLNWFWVEFRPQKNSKTNALSGEFVYVSVDNVDTAYHDARSRGLSIEHEPKDSLGRREFTVTDPNGYKLVFFQKK